MAPRCPGTQKKNKSGPASPPEEGRAHRARSSGSKNVPKVTSRTGPQLPPAGRGRHRRPIFAISSGDLSAREPSACLPPVHGEEHSVLGALRRSRRAARRHAGSSQGRTDLPASFFFCLPFNSFGPSFSPESRKGGAARMHHTAEEVKQKNKKKKREEKSETALSFSIG